MITVREGQKVEPKIPQGNEDPGPDWLLVEIIKDITSNRERFETLDLYLQGDPPKPRVPKSVTKNTWTDEFDRFQKAARTNFAELVVGAALDKSGVVGFRTAAGGDEDGDKEADRLWELNDMDVKADLALADMYAFGIGLLLADPITKRAKHFRPWQAKVITDAVGDPVAALSIEHRPLERRDYVYLWQRDLDDNGVGKGDVYCHIAVRDRDASKTRRRGLSEDAVPLGTYMHQRWVWWKTIKFDGGSADRPKIDTVPLVDFLNRDGVGEYERHLDVLDRINHMLLQRVVIATMQAFKQRALIGDFPKYDAKGIEIDYDSLFPSDPASMWLLPKDAKMWESSQTSIQEILSSVKDDVRDLAAVTRTPMTYFSPDAANGSAEGASLQREGYTNKISDRKKRTAGRWRRFMSLMFQINGDTERAKIHEIEIIWVPTETQSMAEKFSAAAQASTLLPLKTIMREILHFDPKQIRTAELERISQALTTAAQASQAPAGGGPSASMTPLQRTSAANAQLATTNGATSRSTGAST